MSISYTSKCTTCRKFNRYWVSSLYWWPLWTYYVGDRARHSYISQSGDSGRNCWYTYEPPQSYLTTFPISLSTPLIYLTLYSRPSKYLVLSSHLFTPTHHQQSNKYRHSNTTVTTTLSFLPSNHSIREHQLIQSSYRHPLPREWYSSTP